MQWEALRIAGLPGYNCKLSRQYQGMVSSLVTIPVTEILPITLDTTMFVNLKIKMYPQKYPQTHQSNRKSLAVEKRK